MMGNVSENISEDNEAFDERLREVQAKLTQIAKDEKTSKSFDEDLAVVVQSLPQVFIKFVAFLIDHEIPSLTVLAVLSLVHKKAHSVCTKEFKRFMGEEGADFSTVSFSDKEASDTLSLWWTFMILADHHSLTTRLKDINDKKIQEAFWGQIDSMTVQYLDTFKDLTFVHSKFEAKKKQYMGLLYR